MFKRKWGIQCKYEDGSILKFDQPTFRTYIMAREVANATEIFVFETSDRILIFTPVLI